MWTFRTHPRRIYQIDRVIMYIMVWCPTDELFRQRIDRYENRNSWVVISSTVIVHSCVYSTFYKIPTSFFPRVSLTFQRTSTFPYFNQIYFFSIEKKKKNIINRSILDRKSTRLNSSHVRISYAVFCLKKKKKKK